MGRINRRRETFERITCTGPLEEGSKEIMRLHAEGWRTTRSGPRVKMGDSGPRITDRFKIVAERPFKQTAGQGVR